MNIIIFRRELRLEDNTALNYLVQHGFEITPLFIFDKCQIDKVKNKYFSDKCVQFMHESLVDLESKIINKGGILNFFYGDALKIVKNILENNNVNYLVFNEDYTKFSTKRDQGIMNLCKSNGVAFKKFMDIPLTDFREFKTGSGKPYRRFKWFLKKAQESTIKLPNDIVTKAKFNNNPLINKYTVNLDFLSTKYDKTKNLFVNGGRDNGIKTMIKNIKNLSDYKSIRQTPIIGKKNSSSFMSAYLKFGCVSIREFYLHIKNVLGENGNELIRQIIWRDFYYNIVYYYPQYFTGLKDSIVSRFPWKNNKKLFKKWCDGKTGYPFVDAGMRQLNKEGYMNNRARLCCASFLVKNLHINWQLGEQYFAQQLVDYDPSVNNGNWQWVASSSYESQAYYRYMNPTKDLKKFDSKALYVKKYVSELRNEPVNNILLGNYSKNCKYPKKIVDFVDSIESFKNKLKDSIE